MSSLNNNINSIYLMYLSVLKNKLNINQFSTIKIDEEFEKIFLAIRYLENKDNLYFFSNHNKESISNIYKYLENLYIFFVNDIAKELNIQIGFNKMDGDWY